MLAKGNDPSSAPATVSGLTDMSRRGWTPYVWHVVWRRLELPSCLG
jgi:hypothetical protein